MGGGRYNVYAVKIKPAYIIAQKSSSKINRESASAELACTVYSYVATVYSYIRT